MNKIRICLVLLMALGCLSVTFVNAALPDEVSSSNQGIQIDGQENETVSDGGATEVIAVIVGPTGTVTPTEVPSPTRTVTPTKAPSSTGTVIPTKEPLPTGTVTPTKVLSPTGTVTPTPAGTVTPPQTGDNSHLSGTLALFIASAVVIFSWLIAAKRKYPH